MLGLKFKQGVKKQDRVNARVRYIEGDFTEVEYEQWKTLFEEVPEPLSQQEKDEFIKTMDGVKGITGTYSFDSDNNTIMSVAIIELTGGEEVFKEMF